MATQALLFDFDGTLIDSLGPTLAAFQHAIELCGHGRLTYPEIRAHFGAHELAMLEQLVGPERAPVAYRAYREHLTGQKDSIPLHSGVPELLEQARNQGYRLGIITGRGRDSTEELLAHHRLRDRFELILTDHDVPAPKPDPSGLRLALRMLGLPPASALYVGDSWADIRAARAAGLRSFGARWDPLADFSRLTAEETPDHWLDQPLELFQRLDSPRT